MPNLSDAEYVAVNILEWEPAGNDLYWPPKDQPFASPTGTWELEEGDGMLFVLEAMRGKIFSKRQKFTEELRSAVEERLLLPFKIAYQEIPLLMIPADVLKAARAALESSQ